MTIRIATALALALGLGLAWHGPARADGPREAPPGKLTVEGLEKMLGDLGYEYKKSTSSDGKRTYFGLVIKQDSFTYVIDASLDEEGNKLAFSCPLRKIDHPEKVKIERLWKLLAESDAVLPMCFSFDKSSNRFYLNHSIDNRGVTAKVLREELDQTMRVLRRTYPVWNAEEWTELSAPPAATPPLAVDGSK
jgi:hypothetical protein